MIVKETGSSAPRYPRLRHWMVVLALALAAGMGLALDGLLYAADFSDDAPRFGTGLPGAVTRAAPGPAPAQGKIWRVDADAPGPSHDGLSWTTAFTGLQAALDAANISDKIWIAEGVYVPTTPSGRDATFRMQDGVALYGGFGGYGISETVRSQRDWRVHATVLSGDLGRDDRADARGVITATAHISGSNAYHVVSSAANGASTVLDGVIVTGGKADGGALNSGGGIYASSSSLVVVNVTVMGNTASNSGGGMFNRNGSPTLVNVAFYGNTATVRGAGMSNEAGSPTLANVIFSGNQAGSSGGGMANSQGSQPKLINVVFSGNHAVDGGGLYNIGDPAPVLPELTNCILWANTASGSGAQIHNQQASTTTLSYSLVQGGCPGGSVCDHVLTQDPLFARPAGDGGDGWSNGNDDYGDFRVPLASPALDAGDSDALPRDLLDLDGDGNTLEPLSLDFAGQPRILDVAAISDTGAVAPAVDLGVYEAAFVDVTLVKRVSPSPVGPGQALTYTLIFSNVEAAPAANVVISDRVPPSVTVRHVLTAGIPISPVQAGPDYVWVAPTLPGRQAGIITLVAEVDPRVSGVFSLTNRAAITASEDIRAENNAFSLTHTVDAEPPTPPTLLSPANGTVSTTTAFTLTWQASASPDVAGYHLDWNGAIIDVGAVTHYATGALDLGVYTWTVAAYDDLGNLGNFAATWAVTVETRRLYLPIFVRAEQMW